MNAAALPCPHCRRLSEELGIAAVELVRLRAEVLQARQELRHLTVRLSHCRGRVESSAAELSATRAELVEQMCKGGQGR